MKTVAVLKSSAQKARTNIENAHHLAMALLDDHNMFTTGQSMMVAGGYNVKLDSIASLANG